MIYWSEYIIPRFRLMSDNRKNKFYNDIITFDIEVTSFFFSKRQKIWGTPYTIGLDECQSATEYLGLPYIWQCSINGDIIFGRELSEFIIFLENISRKNPYKKYIYIHFLSYEFHFLMSYIKFDKVFARKPHMPIYAISDNYNIEFRCSYFLTNMSLAKLQDNYNLPITNKEGQLNYDIPRLPNSVLSDDELEYCEFDVKVLHELIKHFIKKYGNIPNIPLTQTGEIRRIVKNEVLCGYKHLNKIKNMYPDLENYKILTRVFAGGYTHANYLYTESIVHDVYSFDRASSYPAVMVTEKYPLTRFEKCSNEYKHRNNYCYMSLIALKNFQSISAWDYISEHKCEKRINVSVDNGRIIAGDYAELWVTDIDYDIIVQNYKFIANGSITILQNYRAVKGYLPQPFIRFILQQYVYKTTLKNVKGKEDLYKKAKQFINALYGMCVTNDIRNEVLFNSDTLEFDIDKLTDDDISAKLNKSHFLNFGWGVYITAYARRELWKLIHSIGNDVVYVDTDSVKFVDILENLPKITKYNEEMINLLKYTSNILGIELEMFIPKLNKNYVGMCCAPIGVFEFECIYADFKTYGAKKYAYNYAHNKKFGFTVAGCIKEYYDWNEKDPAKRKKPTIKSLDDFRLGRKFMYGRKVMKYTASQPLAYLTDLQDNEYINTQLTGIVSLNSTYTLGLSVEYDEFLAIYDSVSTHNKYSSPYRTHL